MKVYAAVIATVLSGSALPGFSQAPNRDPETLPIPPTPAAINRILVSQRFTLSRPFKFTWTEEEPMISSGTLVVLDVNPALVVPRNSVREPVLFAGSSAVLRLNHGHQSGRVIGIVPGTVDLTTAPIWFSRVEQPGRVTAQIASAELERATRAGIRPQPAQQLNAARRATANSPSLASLLRTVGADLVLEFSPQERVLADQWRLPVAKPPAKRTN
jgi:hypothetical protein